MKNIQGIGVLLFFMVTIVANFLDCKEKIKELSSVPSTFQGDFVETNTSTALYGEPPIRINVLANSITIFDPNRDKTDSYPITKVTEHETHVDFHYPDKYLNLCIRVYPREGLFYFYDAEIVEEGLSENEIGTFSKSI